MKDDRLYLIHIRERIQRIEQYTKEGKTISLPIPKLRTLSYVTCTRWPNQHSGFPIP